MIAVIGVGCEEVSMHEFYQSVELDDGKYDLFNDSSDEKLQIKKVCN